MNSIATIVLLVILLSIGIVSGQTNPPSEVPTYTGPIPEGNNEDYPLNEYNDDNESDNSPAYNDDDYNDNQISGPPPGGEIQPPIPPSDNINNNEQYNNNDRSENKPVDDGEGKPVGANSENNANNNNQGNLSVHPASAVQGASQCRDCGKGDVQMVIPGNPSKPQQANFEGSDGKNYGYINIPPAIPQAAGGVLMDVAFVGGYSPSKADLPPKIKDNRLGGVIMDIVLQDTLGNYITELVEPMEICIEEEDDNDNVCLAYYNVYSEKWECEDYSPRRIGSQYCGYTDHLTSFALLLDIDDSENYVYAYLSIGFIGIALLSILFAVILIEVKYKYRTYHVQKTLRELKSESENYRL